MMRKWTFFLAFFLLFAGLYAQQFPVTAIMQNGPDSSRINLVILSDGYTQDQMSKFLKDAADVSEKLFQNTPFKEYRSFFNVYAISVPSAESGATHPGTATDVTEPASPVQNINNYFGSTFDYFNIHRLLVARRSGNIYNVLAASFPAYDQTLILVNSPVYGGSGGFFPTSSTHPSAAEISIHELGHSFASLADEYWAGDSYAAERQNMTATANPQQVPWKNWVGEQSVDVFPHGSIGVPARWYKPTSRECKMELLGKPFCAVCREAIIKRIYQLVNAIADFSPKQATVPAENTSMRFSITPLYPEPSTLNVRWSLNGTPLASGVEQVLLTPQQLVQKDNILVATVTDATKLSRSYLPAEGYVSFRRWTITQQVTSSTEALPEEQFQFQCFPNPAGDVLFTRIFSPKQGSDMILSVLSLDGKILRVQKTSLLPGWQTIQTEVHTLPSGTYLLRLQYADWQQAMQWVKL